MTTPVLIWTIVPGPANTTAAPIVVRVTTGPSDVPPAARELLDLPGSIGVCTSSAGEVLVVITDDGAALVSPAAVNGLTLDLLGALMGDDS
jgi:hypothetical protein